MKSKTNYLRCLAIASMLAPSIAFGQARMSAEAVSGKPFGVGRITVPLTERDGALLETGGLILTEENGRALYPAISTGTVRRLLGEVLGGGEATPSEVHVFFLFRGDEPLQLTVNATRPTTVTLTPQAQNPRAASRLMNTWWREYNAATRAQADAGDYPPLIETYLTTMLAQRLRLEPPLLSRVSQSTSTGAKQTAELIFGVEKLRLATLRDTLLGRNRFDEKADRPLPPEPEWAELLPPPPADGLEIEPLARHVPEECFYVRYGTFANYLWLDQLTDEFGGDIGRMISLRGNNNFADQRVQQQLALKRTKLGDLLGGQVIADVAMIGRDMFMREGAAVGMIFQEKNGVLGNDFVNERKATLREFKDRGATLETVRVADRDVSFLSTPDGTLRSYYAVDGKFHLFTTSKAIVQRFYEVGEGRGVLADSPEFKHARSVMPTSRDDTVFVYLSSAFLRGLMSPQYQIELTRRLQSVTDIELLQLAQLAARSEGVSAEATADLIRAGLLPAGFGRRPDGSGPVLSGERTVDSLRGPRGFFTPIPDIAIQGVTPTEAAEYTARAAMFQRDWKQMDPLMIGIKRFALDKKGKERVVVDANISPLAEENYGWLMSLLGPPTTEQITAAPDDIITFHASVKGGLLSSIPPHCLFGAIQDVAPPATDLKPTGLFKTLQILQTTPGYLGAWPNPGFLGLIPFGLASEPDPAGFSRLPFGVWRRQFDDFTVLSFDPDMLAKVTPHLQPVDAESPAQLRLHVGDLSQSKLVPWVNSLNYARARQTSLGNVRMLHALTQQLQVPADEALVTAEKLMDVQLVCSLGGEYRRGDGAGYWNSSAWDAREALVLPEDYQAPLLSWFRGADAELTKTGDRVVMHAEVDIQRKEAEPLIQLPNFNLFGKKKAEAKPEEEKKPAAVEPLPEPKNAAPREF